MLENYELTKENYQKCLFEKFFPKPKMTHQQQQRQRLDVKSTLELRTKNLKVLNITSKISSPSS